jgi:hypothetical protein
MSLGPVQLIVLGFERSPFRSAIATELERLGANGAVRVIDALAVYKDAEGELEVEHLSTSPDASPLGRIVGALVGIAVEDEPGLETAGFEPTGGEREAWDVVEEIPKGSGAALILLEHHWAAPLREAINGAGGFRIGDGFISPLDLVGLGLVSQRDAAALHEIETGATP